MTLDDIKYSIVLKLISMLHSLVELISISMYEFKLFYVKMSVF